ncbi:hypothetical protein WR25_21003 [Diploscapter pachys]|uniref:Uncharacterized protein n=1 Tax=Diploscapter pachys TaxID=2018661 RepID=A0A2A2KFV1_9BILA|nr:hypothetical protein WR25_21003 [Diploscapter pachys]
MSAIAAVSRRSRPNAALQFGAELPARTGDEYVAHRPAHACVPMSTVLHVVMSGDPAPFGRFGGDERAPPVLVGEIPVDRLGDAGLERFGRRPAEFVADAAGVDRIALVVAGAVGDRGHLLGIGLAVGTRATIVEDRAQRLYHLDVLSLVVAADIVGAPRLTPLEHRLQRADVILDVQPVAHLVALAVDRQRLAIQGLGDHQRDQLFGEVIGPVIVRAVGDQHRQSEGMAPSADQMVAARFRRRIGRARIVGRLFGEQACVAEAAVHLVGRDVVETERLARVLAEA